MADHVYLHVGTPKSGTTYVQAVLWQNAETLRTNGFLLPGHFRGHYAAAKGITSRSGRKREMKGDAARVWPRLVKQVNEWPGSAGLSHELLAPASVEQADDAKALVDGAEIHIVLTVRALHKQLPASWQEQVKSGMSAPFDSFLHRVESGEAQGEWFWDVQDVPAIADRWGRGLPADHIHLVTVPPSASDPTLLWQRYASALGIDPAAYDSVVPRRNVSLGVVETELLRQLHAARDERFADKGRHQWTRRLLASEILGHHHSAPIELPSSSREWIEARTAQMVAEVTRRGYAIIGNGDDLAWAPPPADARPTASVTAEEVDEAASFAIARLQEELVQREPTAPVPPVGPDDGIPGVVELLEHIRAADTDTEPRPASIHRTTTTDRIRKSITALRGH